MSEIEVAVWAMAILFIGFKIMSGTDDGGGGKGPEESNKIAGNNQEKERADLYKKREKANFKIEGFLLKREKIEAKIERIELDSSLDFENEREISIEIRELERGIEVIDGKIDKIYNEIENINFELKSIGTYQN